MKRVLFCFAFLLTLTYAVSAQEFKTGYFLDNYTYGYRINPAAPIEGDPYTFFSIGVGNITSEVHTNFPFSSVISNAKDGSGLVLPLLNNGYSESEILASLEPFNNLQMNNSVNLITFGHQGYESRWSVEINLRNDSYLSLPSDFFSFVKRGLAGLASGEYNDIYKFDGLHMDTNLYTELAVGYTAKIGDKVTIGGRVKGLMGFAAVNADWNLDIGPGATKDVNLDTDADINASAPILESVFATYSEGGKSYYDLEQTYGNLGKLSVPDVKSLIGSYGIGAALDLGVTVEPVSGLTLSASVNDLGLMSWKSSVKAHIDYVGELDGEEYGRGLGVENLAGSRYTTLMNYSIHAGAKYRMPFYDRLSVGLLGTFQQHNKEARLGIDITPIDLISLAASAAYGTFGTNVGAALNIRFPGVNLFVGADGMLFNFIPKTPVPQNKVNTTLTAGLVIAI